MTWEQLGPNRFVEIAATCTDRMEFAKKLSKEVGKRVTVAAADGALRRFRAAGSKLPSLDQLLVQVDEPEPETVTVDDPPPSVLELHRMRRTVKDLQAERRQMLRDLDIAERRAEMALAISEPKQEAVIKPYPAAKGKGREATLIVLGSDHHLEETVNPATVMGLNEYNPAIARQRVEAFFKGIAWKVDFFRSRYDLKRLVLWAGGDLISGYLHDELEESNSMAPLEAIQFVQDVWHAGISMLLKETKLDQILIPTNYGNHGRMHKKPRFSTAAENNYEYLAYCSMAKAWKREPRVQWQVTRAAHNYVRVYDWTARFHHGDHCRFNGGSGGISIPILKAVHEWNRVRWADMTFLGHFHQKLDLGHVVVNGSLIGFNAYALQGKFAYQPPEQVACLIDRYRGKVETSSIWVEDSQSAASARRLREIQDSYDAAGERPQPWEVA